ncbi:hypothetical protein SH1V18_11730 [Vallitalea longa]|uniref:SbsA Ig-like domain-containing protein n=1 Tax=Vallitalea longa TaxID=2936439 RepID=A0A9W5YCF2_9FIRM|nr:hypothetical protein [Vallitalea longa]GKX28693.1 hypothetical protein SH1V18_11730 [Vallitalea longa]
MKNLKKMSLGFLVAVLMCTNVAVYASNGDQVRTQVIKAVALGHNAVELTFNNEVDREAAEDVSNYYIHNKHGVVNHEVNVKSAALDNNNTIVILSVDNLKEGTVYEINVDSIMDLDGHKTANSSNTFSVETSTNVVKVMTMASEKNKVFIKFSRPLNQESAEDVSNYNICTQYGIIQYVNILSAELDSTRTIVTLNTSGMKDSIVYSLGIGRVIDFYGDRVNSGIEKFVAGATEPIYVYAIDENTLEIRFTRELNKKSAEDVSHYFVSNKLGVVFDVVDIKSAKLDSTNTIVTLKLGDYPSGVTYIVDMGGIVDVNGERVANYSIEFSK